MSPKGQRDHSGARLTRHAIERFVERFGATEAEAESSLREALARTRRIGRNRENGAVAVLGIYQRLPIIAIFQGDTCLTVLTLEQFEPRLPEFGRLRFPQKWNRLIRRLGDVPEEPDGS